MKEFRFLAVRFGIEAVIVYQGYIICQDIEKAKSAIKFADSDSWGDWSVSTHTYQNGYDTDIDENEIIACFMKSGLYDGKPTELILYEKSN